MPKVPLKTPAVTLASVREQIAEIEFLLEGRLDSDNIQRTGSMISKVGGGSVYGVADFARPITADKLFGNYGNNPDFIQDVYDNLINKIESYPQIDVLEAKFAFDINNKPLSIKPESEIVVTNMNGEMTYEDRQRQALINKKVSEYQRIRKEWYSGDQSNSSMAAGAAAGIGAAGGAAIGTIIAPGLGTAVGAAGGAAIGGLTLLVDAIGKALNEEKMPSTISGLTSLGADFVQTKFIRHPANYKVCTYDDISWVYGDSDNAPFMTPQEIVLTYKISMKCYNKIDQFNRITPRFYITKIDPSTTAVSMTFDSNFIPEDDSDYLIILCDVDLPFKVIP